MIDFDKLELVLFLSPNGNNTAGKYLHWESEEGNAHCRGGFIYSQGELVVPREGFYRVFLQITYNHGGKECVDDELNLLISVGYKANSYPGSITLLEAVDTVSCELKTWTKTLYTAGSFFLETNSTLHVTSTYTELIVQRESQVFFGAELSQ
uniref:THD domain-containing protein n=1 Tax=Echeneis naucrates TaxID=173247 RepID=A0A665VV69_ECHNA